jgi:hypothetical protein
VKGARLEGLELTGAKLAGIEATAEQFTEVKAAWVDFSTRTGEVRVAGDELVAYYSRLRLSGPSTTPSPAGQSEPGRRFFGAGDVLRNASLEFGATSVVDIDSRFENCTITLVEGARLTIGSVGVLEGCHINGPGEIIVHGTFVQGNGTPSIREPRRVIVSRSGSIEGQIVQHRERTQFAFESGCVLRMSIVQNR